MESRNKRESEKDLQRLSFSNCNITAEELAPLPPGLPFINEVYLSTNKQIETQRYADLTKLIVKASGKAEQQGKCIDLQKLSLTNCYITVEELAALSLALAFIKE